MGNDFEESADLSVHERTLLSGLPRQYRVSRLLGRGASGIVLRATDLQMERDVAVKILCQSSDLSFPKRFLREAKVLASLQNPHVVRILRSGIGESGVAFHAMEFLEGETLAEKLARDGRVSMPEFLEVFPQVLDGLDAVHQAGLVHRDLKPSNIMLCRDNDGLQCVKLIDFGIARWVEGGDGKTLTQVNVPLGSPLYMSPEQCKGSAELDSRSDIYSLACIMYESLVGSPPFRADSDMELMYQHLHKVPEKLVATSSSMQMLSGILERCLSKDPELRMQTALEMKLAIESMPKDSVKGNDLKRLPKSLPIKISLAIILSLALIAAVYSLRQGVRTDSFADKTTVQETKVKRLFSDIDRVGIRILSSLKKFRTAHFELPAELISDCKILGNKSLELRSVLGETEKSSRVLSDTVNLLSEVIAHTEADSGSRIMPLLKRARANLELGKLRDSESDFLESMKLVSTVWGDSGQEWRDAYMQYLSCLIEQRKYDEANAGLSRLRALWLGKMMNPSGTWSSTQFLEPDGETRMQMLRTVFDHLHRAQEGNLLEIKSRIALALNLRMSFIQIGDKKYARHAQALAKSLIARLPEDDTQRVKFLTELEN